MESSHEEDYQALIDSIGTEEYLSDEEIGTFVTETPVSATKPVKNNKKKKVKKRLIKLINKVSKKYNLKNKHKLKKKKT